MKNSLVISIFLGQASASKLLNKFQAPIESIAPTESLASTQSLAQVDARNDLQIGPRSIGCYEDLVDNKRDMDTTHIHTPYTKTACLQVARAVGARYASIQWGMECYTSMSPPKFRQVGDGECNKACSAPGGTGNCGGDKRQEVFALTDWVDDIDPKTDAPNTTYIGCYQDDVNARDLSKRLDDLQVTYIGKQECLIRAKQQGYNYASMQYSNECWVSHTAPKLSQVGQERCNMPCTAKGSLAGGICGGDKANQVYALNQPEQIARNYIGCYQDQNERSMEKFIGHIRPDECLQRAKEDGFKYAGTQWYNECWASATKPKTLIPEEKCNTPCTAIGSIEGEICGGGMALSVYALDADETHVSYEQLQQAERVEREADAEAVRAKQAAEEDRQDKLLKDEAKAYEEKTTKLAADAKAETARLNKLADANTTAEAPWTKAECGEDAKKLKTYKDVANLAAAQTKCDADATALSLNSYCCRCDRDIMEGAENCWLQEPSTGLDTDGTDYAYMGPVSASGQAGKVAKALADKQEEQRVAAEKLAEAEKNKKSTEPKLIEANMWLYYAHSVGTANSVEECGQIVQKEKYCQPGQGYFTYTAMSFICDCLPRMKTYGGKDTLGRREAWTGTNIYYLSPQ